MPTPLNPAQVADALQQLAGWSHEDDKLKQAYRFADFNEALGFIVRVGLLAERHNHHPELFNVYNTVRIALSTHDADDKVTQKDVDLARAIQKLHP